MKNILIVDDDKTFLLNLMTAFKAYSGSFMLWKAENGRIAMEILQGTKIDLLVTDLQMPMMDGFELLAYMSINHPQIPVLALSDTADPGISDKLHALDIPEYLKKPISPEALARKIFEKFQNGAGPSPHDIKLETLLTLLEMEKMTCTLKVIGHQKTGLLYFSQGKLIHAQNGASEGEEAACEIISWESVKLEMESGCQTVKKPINSNLTHILIEALRLKDERIKP